MRYDLNECVTVVPDFPKIGVSFKDVSPLLRHKFAETIEAMLSTIPEEKLESIDAFVGSESRGFIFAAGMAAKTGKGVVLARKKGKLPNVAVSVPYGLEYGEATIEMQAGKGNVWEVDDVMALGGTMAAQAEASTKAGYNVVGMSVLVNLPFLNNFEWQGMKCHSVIDYGADGQMVEPAYKPAALSLN